MPNLKISFAENSEDTIQAVLGILGRTRLCVQVIPEDGSRPFRGVLLGTRIPASHYPNEIKVVRLADQHSDDLNVNAEGTIEYLRANEIVVF